MTHDHAEIKNWIKARDGRPAMLKDEPNALTLRFKELESGAMKLISWTKFFQRFEEDNLALVYQEVGDGGEIRSFCRLLPRR